MATTDTDANLEVDETRRSSIEKTPIIVSNTQSDAGDDEPSAFERLPDEIIQQYAWSYSSPFFCFSLTLSLCLDTVSPIPASRHACN